MCFPSSRNGGRQPCGTHPSLNNTGRSRRQALLAALLAVLVASTAGSCSRRGGSKAAKRPVSLPDGGTGAVAASNPTASPPMTPLPEVAPTAKPGHLGGTLKIHLEAEPPHLNPLQETVQVIDRVTAGLIYETLLECQGGRYLPGLAETWEVSADGLRVILRLRSGVRWHDDRPLSPMDVQATFEYLVRAPARSQLLHAMIADVEGVDMMVDHSVRLRLLRPSGLTLRALCEIPILPAEPLRTGGARLAQLARAPIGTGPFRVAGWERGKRIKLVRARSDEPGPGAHLDEITFEIDADPARALTRLRRGELDILPRVADVHYPEQVSQATLRDALELRVLKPDRYSFVALNTRHGVLGDQEFRHALSLLWDRARFANEFRHGLAHPIGAPTFGRFPADAFDRERAGRLLEQAGYKDTDGDGVREVGGSAIRLTFLVPAGARTAAAEVRAFAMDMRRAGVLLDVTNVDSASLLARVEHGDFDMAALTWDGRRDEDPRLLLTGAGDFEYTGYRPERLTNLVDLVRLAPDPSARSPLLAQLADLLGTDRPALFLYRHDVPLVMSRRVHGLAAVGDRLDLRGVWVDP